MHVATKNLYHTGVAALFIIVVVGSSALLMAVGASLLGMSELTSGFVTARGQEALALADGCLEEALERIRYNSALDEASIENNEPLYALGSCTIEMTDIPGPYIQLEITATIDGYYKKIVGVIDPAVEGNQLVSWTEASN
ncbi:MAG: hypothetical protein EXS68_01610 [Candidatus Ryanbacteria bacterium]|nr:hypothetical protein [Candidatus Ryanbacteria bacterium]